MHASSFQYLELGLTLGVNSWELIRARTLARAADVEDDTWRGIG